MPTFGEDGEIQRVRTLSLGQQGYEREEDVPGLLIRIWFGWGKSHLGQVHDNLRTFVFVL